MNLTKTMTNLNKAPGLLLHERYVNSDKHPYPHPDPSADGRRLTPIPTTAANADNTILRRHGANHHGSLVHGRSISDASFGVRMGVGAIAVRITDLIQNAYEFVWL